MRKRDLFLSCERGNIAMMFALSAPVLVGAAALGVETGFDYFRQVHLQAAADAAAYAGALEKLNGSPTPEVVKAAEAAAQANGWSAERGTIAVHTPPTSGAHQVPEAVEVQLSRDEPRFFTALFFNTPVTVRGRGVARISAATNACILTLNKSKGRALQIQGSAKLNLKACDLMANSTASDAVFTWGNSYTEVGCIASAGGVESKDGTVALTACSNPVTQATPAKDPFADIPTPETPIGGCKQAAAGSVLTPGHYCNGISITDAKTLQPGVYYVSGGDFRLNGGAKVTGSGVTIYLAGQSRVALNGNATINLSAPTSGDYSGILFFGDRTSQGVTHTFNGSAQSTLTGHLYFPNHNVDYSGNFSGVDGCMNLVADTARFMGSGELRVDCTEAGMKPIPSQLTALLVE